MVAFGSNLILRRGTNPGAARFTKHQRSQSKVGNVGTSCQPPSSFSRGIIVDVGQRSLECRGPSAPPLSERVDKGSPLSDFGFARLSRLRRRKKHRSIFSSFSARTQRRRTTTYLSKEGEGGDLLILRRTNSVLTRPDTLLRKLRFAE